MDSNIASNHNQPVRYEKRLGAIKIQLHSQLPSDVRRGMEQARKLLQEDPSNSEIHQLLLMVVNEIPSQREEIKKLFQDLVNKDSTQAKESLKQLESGTHPDSTKSNPNENVVIPEITQIKQTIIDDADDAYYAAEFDKAINLYRKALQEEPNNKRAQQQLEKAELNRISQHSNRKLPREAMQNYRRARSFIAARDTESAIGMLNAAIEEAQAHGTKFQEAEEVLGSQLSLQIAAEYKEQTIHYLREEKWDNALEKYTQILKLDPTDEVSNSMREKLANLVESEAILITLSDSLDTITDRKTKLDTIASSIKDGENILMLTNTRRFKSIRARYGLYRAESDLHNWGVLTALAPQSKLIAIQKESKNMLTPNDPALKYVEERLRYFWPTRIFVILILILILIAIIFQLVNGKFNLASILASLLTNYV